MTDETGAALDLNAAFRGGGRSIEWLDQINQASIVMLAETGIVRAEVAGRIARGIARLMDEEQSNASRRRSSADYLDYEPRLTTLVGADASRLHSGRSRQDLASTIARMNLRDGLLQVLSALLRLRERVHARASEHIDTIIPAYTHGVQAQPTTFAHYLHALSEALARECERIMQVHARVNRNPLGAAVLATSSFPIDRARLSALLGFEGLVENAYDANHLAPVDSVLEVAGSYAIAALQIGQFAQDVHAQYADPVPWMLLATGELTGTSSIMPQKRNPAALEQLRAQASMWLGEMQSQPLLAHNNRTGMFDYRLYDPVPHARAVQVLDLARRIVDGLVVDAERALNMVLADYSTTTEIADVLAQVADVPFRIGHHFASKLTDHGRSKGLRLHEIPYETVARLYQTESGQALPLDEAALRRVTSAEHMVQGRRGQGGPQRVEMQRMLDAERTRIDACDEWLRRSRADLAAADATREQAFRALCDGD